VLAPHTESVDFYVSAFVSAARSVTFAMSKDYGASTEDWTTAWILRLASKDDIELMAFFVGQRNKNEKQGSADLELTTATISEAEFVREITSQGGSYLATGTPGTPPPTFDKSETRFLDRPDQPIVSVCKSYLQLLNRLLADFESEH
jgi:hypothetical protein